MIQIYVSLGAQKKRLSVLDNSFLKYTDFDSLHNYIITYCIN